LTTMKGVTAIDFLPWRFRRARCGSLSLTSTAPARTSGGSARVERRARTKIVPERLRLMTYLLRKRSRPLSAGRGRLGPGSGGLGRLRGPARRHARGRGHRGRDGAGGAPLDPAGARGQLRHRRLAGGGGGRGALAGGRLLVPRLALEVLIKLDEA